MDQDEGDVYGGFRRRFKLKKSRSTEPWSTTRKPRLPAIRRRIASAWAHNYFWLFLVVLAVITSISAFVMDETAANLRKGLINGVLRTGGSQKDYGVILYIFLRVAITLIAVELTKRIAPIAAGSGIPEVKSILAGFSIPGFLEPRTLVAKVLGVGVLLLPTRRPVLPIGEEGPRNDRCTQAAILAELLMRVPFFARHTNELFRNQMLSAAAAVGVSAALARPSAAFYFLSKRRRTTMRLLITGARSCALRSGRSRRGSWRSSPTGRSRHILIRSHISTGRSGSSYCCRRCAASWEASS